MSNTTNTFIPKFHVDNQEGYGKALRTLHEEISTINKNITYLDVYNIVDVVTDKINFSAQVGKLGVNSALIINAQPFSENSVNYNTGDIIYKTSTGNVIHIRAQAGGIYYPKNIDQKDGGLSITYAYASSTLDGDYPGEGEKEIGPYQTIEFSNLQNQTSNTNIYGLWIPYNEDNKELAGLKDENGNLIQPQIQFWLVNDNSPAEQIFIDYSLKTNGDNWVVELSDISERNDIYMKVK